MEIDRMTQNAVPSISALAKTALNMLKLGFLMFVASQLAAGAIYFGINWRTEFFLARAQKTEGTLLGVNPDMNGYRVQLSYGIDGKTFRTSVLVRNPPAIHLGEKLDVFVDRANFWKAELSGPPKVSLGFLQLGCAGFAFFFYFFMALGAFATSAILHSPQVTAELARMRSEAEHSKAA